MRALVPALCALILSPAVASAQRVPCAEWFDDLADWIRPRHPVAFHLAMSKSRGATGHFSVTEGFLDRAPNDGRARAIATIPFPTDEWVGDDNFDPGFDWPEDYRATPTYVLESLVQEWRDTRRPIYRRSSIRTARRDDVAFRMRIERGARREEDDDDTVSAQIELLSWGDTRLPLEHMVCSRDLFGYYLTGIASEVNGTRAVALSIHSPYRYEVKQITGE